MSLRSTPVSKCLDKKLMAWGFEIFDLIAIFLTLSILNFIFGQTQLKLFLVWLPTLSLALVLRLGKRGKPDGYLMHWFRYQLKSGSLSAFHSPTVTTPPPRLKPTGSLNE